jgi:hypothetical protein
MGAHRHTTADFGQVQIHRRGVGVGQDERRPGVTRRANGPENIGPFIPAIARRGWARAALGPKPGQRPLLADTRFVLPP